MTIRKKLV